MTRRASLIVVLVGALIPACSHRAAPPPLAPRAKVVLDEFKALPVSRDGATYCGPYFGGPYPGVRRILADGEPDDQSAASPPRIGAAPSPEFFERDHWF